MTVKRLMTSDLLAEIIQNTSIDSPHQDTTLSSYIATYNNFDDSQAGEGDRRFALIQDCDGKE